MIKLVVANGCSYTRGAELGSPDKESWPVVLGRLLDVPVVNLASDGGSNRRIVRTTVANIERVSEEFGVPLSATAVVCMWTGMARNECYGGRRRDRGNRPDLPYETRWHRLGRWRIEEGDNRSEAYFRHLWNEQGAVIDLLTDWIMLDAFLDSRGVAARYAFSWDVLPSRIDEEGRDLISRIRPSSVFGNKIQSKGSSFYDLIRGVHDTGNLYHPLAPAHEYFARQLAEWLSSTGLRFATARH